MAPQTYTLDVLWQLEEGLHTQYGRLGSGHHGPNVPRPQLTGPLCPIISLWEPRYFGKVPDGPPDLHS